jgi:hypothetical protein
VLALHRRMRLHGADGTSACPLTCLALWCACVVPHDACLCDRSADLLERDHEGHHRVKILSARVACSAEPGVVRVVCLLFYSRDLFAIEMCYSARRGLRWQRDFHKRITNRAQTRFPSSAPVLVCAHV